MPLNMTANWHYYGTGKLSPSRGPIMFTVGSQSNKMPEHGPESSLMPAFPVPEKFPARAPSHLQ